MKRIILAAVVPKIRNETQFEILIDFLRAIKETYNEVCYVPLSQEKTNRLPDYDKFILKLKEMGYVECQTTESEKLIIFQEDGENSIESEIKNKKVFYEWAKIFIAYKIHSLDLVYKNKSSDKEKEDIKNQIENLLKIKERIDKMEQEEIPQNEFNKGKLYIHIDLANFTPLEISNKDEFWKWLNFIDDLILLSKKEFNKNDCEVFVYLEGNMNYEFKKYYEDLRSGKIEKKSRHFMERFKKLDLETDDLIKILKLKNYSIEIPPKEAEQLIPDKISEIKKKEPDSIHVIITDDKARDTTECDLRIIYLKRNVRRVQDVGKAKKVISIEQYYELFPTFYWFLRILKEQGSIEIDLKEPVKEEKVKFQLRELDFLKQEINQMKFLTPNRKTEIIYKLLSLYYQKQEKFLDFWKNLEHETKFELLENIEDLNGTIIIFFLFKIFENETDLAILQKIRDFFKKKNEEFYFRLSNLIEEKELEYELNKLQTRYEEKIETYQKIQNYKEQIEQIKKISEDENINEITLRRVEQEYYTTKRNYEELKQKITYYKERQDSLQKEINQLQQEEKELENQNLHLSEKSRQLKEKVNKLRNNVEKLQSEVLSYENEKQNLEKTDEELKNKKDELKRKIETLKNEIAIYEQDNKNMEKEVNEKEQKLEKYKEIKQKYEKIKELEMMEKEIQKLKDENKIKEENLQSLRRQKDELKNKNENLEKEVNELKSKNNELTHNKNNLINEKQILERENKQLQEEISKLSNENREKSKNIINLIKKRDELKSKDEMLKSKEQKLTEEVRKLSEQKEELEKEVNELEERKKFYEGFKKDLEERRETLVQYRNIKSQEGNKGLVKEIDELIRKIDKFLSELS
ncbi:MAG: hypothetical protein ABIL76_05030 [candidate division WOR-3 bacterium]